MAVESRIHPKAYEATTGSHLLENQIAEFNPLERRLVVSSTPTYSLSEYIEVFGITEELNWHLENIELGAANKEEQLQPDSLRERYLRYVKDPDGLKLVADHEAGHFCAGEKEGLQVDADTIPEGNRLGVTRYHNLRIDPSNVRSLRKAIVLSLAGGHGAKSNFGTGSDHGKANQIARYMSAAHKEGSVSSILNNGHNEASRASGRGTKRFMQVSRILYLKRNIKNY